MIMRGVRSLPLVGIVEFILYGCAKYFRDRYMAVSPSLANPAVLFGYKMTEYMDAKIKKSSLHDVRVMGTRERRFEVTCKGRSNRGMHRNRVVHKCLLAEAGTIHCSCCLCCLQGGRCSARVICIHVLQEGHHCSGMESGGVWVCDGRHVCARKCKQSLHY